MIFNPHTSQSFEEVLSDVKNMLNIEYPPVTALYTAAAPQVKVATSVIYTIKHCNDCVHLMAMEYATSLSAPSRNDHKQRPE